MRNLIIALLVLTSLQACKKDKLDEFDVVYEVEFISTWSATTHPTDFPSDPHFSPFVVVSHLASAQLFIPGLNASEGVKDVAETGSRDAINNEIQVLQNTSVVLDKAEGGRLDSPGNSNAVQLGVRSGFQTVTAISMIAPSPDWFVATTTTLQDPTDGLWYDEVISYVLSYDSGTDSGTTFTSANEGSNPIEPIRLIETGPLTEGTDTVVNMGYFKFTRIQ